jgi:hypothetical protein
MPLPSAQSIAARHADRASAYKAKKGLQEHELVLFAAYLPDDHDLASSAKPAVSIVRIEPTPRIVNKGLDTVDEKSEIVRLQQYEVSRISRQYLDDDLDPLYWMILTREQFGALEDQTISVEDAQNRVYARYGINGSPELLQNGWTLMLKEER